MDEKTRYLLLKTVQDNNILPITSVCNMSCRFCSHNQNPSGVEVYSFGSLELDYIKELINYLSPEQPVILGESATKIIEGEPFLHPCFKDILTILRQRWPDKEIKITTNGSFLNKEIVKFLHKVKPVELNVSLNCANPEERVFLMSDPNPQAVFKGLGYLSQYNINFNGSIVAMPHILGWDSLEETITFLADYGSRTIRIFMPGFTKYTDRELRFDLGLLVGLDDFIADLKCQVPVLLEPPHLKDFQVRVKGIISGSPAAGLDIKSGDIIKEINGEIPLTRVEAFNKLTNFSILNLLINRDEKQKSVKFKKKKGERPGFILDYDLPVVFINRLQRLLDQSKAKNILIITSLLAKNIIRKLVKEIITVDDKAIEILPVENKFFGGSIMSAGLLTNSDIMAALMTIDYKKKDLIVIPGIIYDIFGNDLTGSSYNNFSSRLDVDIKIIDMNYGEN